MIHEKKEPILSLEERRRISTFYSTKGSGLISSSENIGKDSNTSAGFDILLYIGIELILKSFLIIKDENITEKKLVSYYGHDIKRLIRDAQKYDELNTISSDEFIDVIDWLLEAYSPNMIELRYNDKEKMRIFPIMIYDVLTSKLIAPMNYILREFVEK